ncbi:2-oxo-tetronate isomerase [Polaromonas sp. JS666]|uniref:2-oxo-tetronate isomerase n=1 Tax=Polaromonas sp. (strain JS666 / ATCC BAA-500) TaxID=296591 RepID=UPI00088330DF|nr:2-oxo-tetronate isomerase [Polaromonas sp. JS666]SDO14178.1 hydroxypyruvate isomerase [Polaromonas sp. JS666]
MPQFAANLSWMYTELPMAERFAAAARDGFTGVEILSPYVWAPDELKAMLQRHGQQLVLFNGPPGGVDPAGIEKAWASSQKGTACLPGREAEFRAGIAIALEYAQALACPRIHVMAGVLPVGVEREAVQPTYVNNLSEAAALAARVGVELLIEPINTRDIPRFFLNRQDHAHEIIREVGAANLKVQMDLYHCQVVEGDLAMKLRKYLPTGHVGHLQIAGAPGRHEPDVGEINYPYLLALLDELGYGGWVGCEYKPLRGAQANATSDGLGWLKKFRERA